MIQPVKIFRTEKGELGFDFDDGSRSVFKLRDLRLACPCALCVDENTGAHLLDPSTVPEDISIESIQSIGRYAVGILWSDGHRTGIYPYDFLQRLTKAK
ncbi:MAG: DUF971 domain-containing protein [Fibrobacteraceae bacterium]|nr:DUF971 domain-containing protein [Fibrobacteraceae bacterium]